LEVVANLARRLVVVDGVVARQLRVPRWCLHGILLTEFEPAPTGFVALATTTEIVKTASDEVRPGWDTHAAPCCSACVSLLLTGGPDAKPGRHLSCGESNLSRSTERLREPRQHHEIGVEAHSLQAANAERSKAVLVLQ